jgi:hypothetical protein
VTEDPTRPENPRSEPEIIPPGHTGGWPPRGGPHVWISIDRDGHRTYVKPPGPFTIVLAVVGLILVVAVVLMLVLGALLIWVPVVAVIAAVFVVVGFLRGYFRRLG